MRIGVDGCRAGWFYVAVSGESMDCGVVESVGQLFEAFPAAERICIDIPIGLSGSCIARACDAEARRMLGRRSASVFNAPVRPVLRAASYEHAKRISRRITGKALSIQSWMLVPKIAEVDRLARSNSGARACLLETHPEVSFAMLNGGQPMNYAKRSAEGRAERMALLTTVMPQANALYERALQGHPRRELARDDILDALICAYTAGASTAALRTVPNEPSRDACGLPMQILYRACSAG